MKNRLGSIIVIFLAPALASYSIAAKTHSTRTTPSFGVNLVVNGDAEMGPGSPDDGATLMPIPGWTRKGVFQVVQYGASGGFTGLTETGPASRGKNYFVGGPGSKDDQTSASQVIDVKPLAATLSKGKSHYTFSAYLGGFSNQRDCAYVTASFQNAKGHALAGAKLGPVTQVDRKDKNALLPRSKTGVVPKGTTRIVVTMVSIRFDGIYHDGSLDNIVLTLTSG